MTDGIVVQLVAGPEETIAPREMYPAREILQQYDGADIQIVTKKSPSPASTSVLPVVQELIANIPWAALASGGVVVARSATAIAREWLAGHSKRSVEI